MGVINEGFCKTVCVGDHVYQILGNTADGCPDKKNQDSFGYVYGDCYLIAVIADGLGSAPLSHIGSHNIVESVFKVMSDPYTDNNWEHIFDHWKSSLGTDIEQYDTTCKFICIINETVTIGSIGDGWIGILDTQGYHELENTNTFTNRTESICSQNMVKKACLLECGVQDIIGIGMSTDGFSEDFDSVSRAQFLGDVCKTMADDYERAYREICSVLIDWPVKSNRDDKTLILIKKVD